MMRRSIVWQMGAGVVPALALALALGAASAARAGEKVGEMREGDKGGNGNEQATVPNFVLKDLAGKDVSLADLRESGPVVLTFWATWCQPCKRELPHVEALRKEYEAKGLTVVAVSIDDTRSLPKVKPFIETNGYGFKVLLDSNQRVLRQLQGTGAPYAVVISADGRYLYTHSGYREGDEKELAKVVAEAMASAEAETAPDGAAKEAPAPSTPADEGGGQPAAGGDH